MIYLDNIENIKNKVNDIITDKNDLFYNSLVNYINNQNDNELEKQQVLFLILEQYFYDKNDKIIKLETKEDFDTYIHYWYDMFCSNARAIIQKNILLYKLVNTTDKDERVILTDYITQIDDFLNKEYIEIIKTDCKVECSE